MNIKQIKAVEVVEGNIIQNTMDSIHRSLVVDVRENASMNGVWLEFGDYSARFFGYEDTVYLATFD